MAASRDIQEGAHLPDPRPTRIRHPPVYLEDYVLSHPLHPTTPTSNVTLSGHLSHASHVPSHSNVSFAPPGATALYHLEEWWRNLSMELKELHIAMDDARRSFHDDPRSVSPY